jgi:hypothetical protein
VYVSAVSGFAFVLVYVRRLCLALPLSSYASRCLLLVARLQGKTPEMSPHWFCTIRPVCVLMSLSIYSTHNTMFIYTHTAAMYMQHTYYSTFFTSRNATVVPVLAGFNLEEPFYTQLAPQQIKSSSCSTQIQEHKCVLHSYFTALSVLCTL